MPASGPNWTSSRTFLLDRGLSQEMLPEELLYADSIPRTEFGEFNRGEVRAWVVEQLHEVRS